MEQHERIVASLPIRRAGRASITTQASSAHPVAYHSSTEPRRAFNPFREMGDFFSRRLLADKTG